MDDERSERGGTPPMGDRTKLCTALTVAGLLLPTASEAATFTVTNTADSGPGSFRQAWADAKAAPSDDSIVFDPSVTGTIDLSSTGALDTLSGTTGSLSVVGPGDQKLTIKGNGVAVINQHPAWNPTNNLTVSGLTFENAPIETIGGPSRKVEFRDNVFKGAKGIPAFRGSGANFLVDRCAFDGNTAGALSISSGTVVDSSFKGNSNSGSGGAVIGAAKFERCTFEGNSSLTAGGALYNFGHGGLVVINSTFSSNTAPTGSALYSVVAGQTSIIRSSSFVGNRAQGTGAALFASGETAPQEMILESVLFADNTNATGPLDLFRENAPGTVSVSHSLVFAPGTAINGANTDNVVGVDAQVEPLANNGGLTKTHALKPTSPAIDKGSNSTSIAFDQRGSGFPRSVGQPDIGAFEVQPPAPDAGTAPDGGSSDGGSSGSTPPNGTSPGADAGNPGNGVGGRSSGDSDSGCAMSAAPSTSIRTVLGVLAFTVGAMAMRRRRRNR